MQKSFALIGAAATAIVGVVKVIALIVGAHVITSWAQALYTTAAVSCALYLTLDLYSRYPKVKNFPKPFRRAWIAMVSTLYILVLAIIVLTLTDRHELRANPMTFISVAILVIIFGFAAFRASKPVIASRATLKTRCLYCRETIHVEATRCKHCHGDLVMYY